MAADRQYAHQLIERLEAIQLPTAVRLLEFVLLDPVAQSMAAAQPDDEPLSQEDSNALANADQWLLNNKPISHEEVLAEFGLTIADFPLKANV